MICKKCGAQIPDNSAECSFCGAEYEVAPVEEETPENAAVEQEQENLGNDYSGDEIDRILDDNEKNRRLQNERINSEKQKQLEEIAKRRTDKKKRQRRNRALVVLSVVAVAGAVAAGVNHVKHNKKDIPDVVVVSHEPTQPAVDVVTSPDATEGSDIAVVEGGETAADAPGAGANSGQTTSNNNSGTSTGNAAGSTGGSNGGTSWRSTGGGGSTGSTASGLAPSTGSRSSGSSSSGTAKSSSTSGGSASSSGSATASGSSSSTAGGSSSSASSKSGYSNGKFSSALVTGGEVVTVNGKNYMSFTYEGKTYYANIAAGTKTADISGKPMTINAAKTSDSYNGSTVYEITDITSYDGNYIFPESGYKLLKESDLSGKTAWELKVGRNEIYARHGRTFKDKDLQAYFNSCSWYKVNPDYNFADDSANLNPTEIKNAFFILDYENSH